jgi:hypothetical protein
MAIIGDDERVRGEVAIKDMKSGEQQSVKRDKVANALQNRERIATGCYHSTKEGVQNQESIVRELNARIRSLPLPVL